MENKTKRRLVVVSNRLPFQLQEKKKSVFMKESDGGLVSALNSYFEREENKDAFSSVLWIGSADFPQARWEKYLENPRKGGSFDVDPIFIETRTYNRYYNGFCNATIWPLFHYFPSLVEFDEETFHSYEEVNHLFAEKILSTLLPDDILWIHDYQLMQLPGLIREKRPDATIGFFLHIPFPSFEIFRLLHKPWKEKIVSGMLGADLIGFHTHEYVQHFLKTVQMVHGFDSQFRTIIMNEKTVKAEMFPLGIDFDKFHNAGSNPKVQERLRQIRENFHDKKIIFSVDRLDYTKGVTHRLSGFERFLDQHPEWRSKVVFILIIVPSRQIISKYNERKKMIEERVGRINGKYSSLEWQPIIYRYSNLSFEDLCAMYQSADAGLITPIRDGMNLVAKEYIASQQDKGVLILSELAGAANEMGEAILVNPMDKEEVAQSIFTALTMPDEMQTQKLVNLQKRLREYSVAHWVTDFLKQLDEVKEYQVSQRTKHISPAILEEITRQYKAANKRHLFLDYDGTLVPFSKHPKLAIPDRALIDLLHRVAADDRTIVTIISGRDSQTLQEWFNDLPVNLVAEHGASVRLKNGEWKHHREIDQSWKPVMRPTMELYAQRSPGSFLEEKTHTLAWHYRNVLPDLGFIRSRELLDNLHHLVRNTPLQIIDGNKVIEVRISGVDKGSVARQFLQDEHYDFVMAAGDDKTDEDMFRALAERAVTIKIGPGHTAAQYNLSNQQEVLELLNKLIK
ncbi:MAG: bifunctional alpha,alpha-trehalose-phosphate synthase (UDP-forming)/trehalose-phosphatase [Bacteroidota bacterium]|nr:bifunctional alpha,alpha-trehalose-phosphate synthase (UDP-forming)/trehalose-phosphatase [Bacteroidota bacterium]